MDNVTDFPNHEQPEWHFPILADEDVVIEGRKIHRLTARTEGENIALILDGRFSISVPEERGIDVAWFVANALAIGAGYSDLTGEHELPLNPRTMQFGWVEA
jgi:hypothetical protein